MSSVLLLVLGALAMVGLIAAAYAAQLVFHGPDRPGWLDIRRVDEAVVFVLVGLGVLDFGVVLKDLVLNGVDPLAALSVEFAFCAIAAALLWRRFHMKERLGAARHGLSPFAELRHIRHHQRHRFDGPHAGSGATGTA